MIASDDVRRVTFDRAMRGYRCEDVDDYLKQVADSIDSLAAENDDLQKKLVILAQRIDQYRADEDTLSTTMINAQRLGENVIKEAKQKAAEIIRAAVVYEGFGPLTNGSNLLYGFTSFASFNLSLGGTTLHLETVMPFLFSGICIAIILLLINSTYGRAFKAIRDDEIAAEAMGINLASHKRMSFIISSFFAGISGAMLAMYQASVQATTFKSSMTYEILLIVVIGGIGSVSGSIIASFLFIASSEWLLRFLDNETWIGGFRVPLLRSGFRMVVFSIIIMAVVLFFRKGIMGDRELFQKKPASTAKAAKKEARSK